MKAHSMVCKKAAAILGLLFPLLVLSSSNVLAMEQPEAILRKALATYNLSDWTVASLLRTDAVGNAYATFKKVKRVKDERGLTEDATVYLDISLLNRKRDDAPFHYGRKLDDEINKWKNKYTILEQNFGGTKSILYLERSSQPERNLRPHVVSDGYSGKFLLTVTIRLGTQATIHIMDEGTAGKTVKNLSQHIFKIIEPLADKKEEPGKPKRIQQDNRSDCGKSGALTRYLSTLRGHQRAIAEMNGEFDRMLAGSKPDQQTVILIGEKAKSISTAFQKTLREFSAAETRRGLFEELDLILDSVLTLNQAVEKYQKLASVPVVPLQKSIIRNCKANVAKTVFKLAREEYASRLESEGLRDILTSASWNEVLEKAAYHTQRKVDEFLDRETEKIFSVGFHDAESVRRSLQAKMRQEVRRQVAKLLVKVTSNEIVIEIAAGPIIRWFERDLYPRLREALRQKGNLPNRLARSMETLDSTRDKLNQLPCTAKLREVRRRLNAAAGAITATRYLERDLLKANAINEYNRLDETRRNLARTMNFTRERFLLVMDDYEDDLAFANFVVDQMVKNLSSAIPSNPHRLKNLTAPAIPSSKAGITGLKYYEGGNDGVPYDQRSSGPKTAVELEEGYDRPGGEYITHSTDVSTPQACLDLCRGNAACVAFTWVRPNIQGPTGVCWLKGSLGRKVSMDCCVSGVVKAVKEDRCELRKTGATSSCFCQNSLTGKWYATNPGACP